MKEKEYIFNNKTGGFDEANAKSSVDCQVSVLAKLPRCCFLSDAGRRCKKSANFRSNVFLDYGIYKKTLWVEVNLCSEHFLQLGNNKKKARLTPIKLRVKLIA